MFWYAPVVDLSSSQQGGGDCQMQEKFDILMIWSLSGKVGHVENNSNYSLQAIYGGDALLQVNKNAYNELAYSNK